MKRRTNLKFFVLVIDKPTNDVSRSRNGEALFLLFRTFFFFHFFDNFSKKTKFEQTNLITVYVSDDLDVF